MSSSRLFFIAFSIIIALVGLLTASIAHDYLYVFGLGLFGFGVLFGFGCVKRHFDESAGLRQP
jgi:hypothetical protein